MDSRIYFHQYRRPRNSNPTYVSSNVQNSMTFFNGGYYPETKTIKEPYNRYNFQPTHDTSHEPASTPLDSYRPSLQQPRNNGQYDPPSRQQPSKLSNYGVRSLQLDQRGVVHKQTSPYNIISLKPKEFNDDIKQYPWFSVENRDDVYYKRMNQVYNQKDYYTGRAKTYEKQSGGSSIAGKHTYDLQPKLNLDPQKRGGKERFTAKMLNHMDELQHSLA